MQAISKKLEHWLKQRWPALDHAVNNTFDSNQAQIEPLAMRRHVLPITRYFRITAGGVTLLVVDLSSGPEETAPGSTAPVLHHDAANCFVAALKMQVEAGLNSPQIIAQDAEQGFLLLSDLNGETYLQALVKGVDARSLLDPAGAALIRWQQWRPNVATNALPTIDAARLTQELHGFADFYLAKHLGLALNEVQQKILAQIFSTITRVNLGQQQTLVHGDFVLENLLVCQSAPALRPSTGAAFGPISLDIASLYKDAFLSFEEEPLLDGTIRYWEKAKKTGLPVPADFGDFYRDVEWMGLQRHIYLLGAFARQHQLDGDTRYINDAHRFLRYIRRTGERYAALFPLLRLLDALKIDDGLMRKVGVSF